MKLISTKAEFNEFVDEFDSFLFDMDGVIWSGENPLEKSIDALKYLIQKNKKIVFVTNNSSKSRQSYALKLQKYGVNVTQNEVFGSSYAVVKYLDSINFSKTKKCFLLGEDGLREELKIAGYNVMDSVQGDYESMDKLMEIKDRVDAVICGFDGKTSYVRLAHAHSYLEDPNCLFIATNMDSTYPGPNGRTFPGSGSLIMALVTSTKRTPVVVGKPNQLMMDLILSTHNFQRERTVMVGDRLDTDILFGKKANIKTLLVLSGCTKQPNEDPDYVIPKIGHFI